MSITSISYDNAAQPSVITISTNDTYATITAPGYLDSQATAIQSITGSPVFPWNPNAKIFVNYAAPVPTQFNRDPSTGTLSEVIPSGTGKMVYVTNVSILATDLTMGGSVVVYPANSSTAQYLAMLAYTYQGGSSNFDGSGDRTIVLTDGQNIFGTFVQNALQDIESYPFAYTDGISNPNDTILLPGSGNYLGIPTNPGADIVATYDGSGSIDYTSGEIVMALFLLQIAN